MNPRILLLTAACSTPTSATLDVGDPGRPVLHRLTQPQYERSVEELFGPDLVVPAEIEPDLRMSGLHAIGSGAATISPRGVERYEQAAFQIAEQALTPDRRDRWLVCEPTGPDDIACYREAMANLGRRAWRRPLTEMELDEITTIATTAATTLDEVDQGLRYGVATLLQSPHHLMRTHLGDEGALTPFELASRLSFLLWDAPPDADLLDAAEAGTLATTDELDIAAQRLLTDTRAHDGVRALFEDWFELDELLDLRKDPEIFPHMTGAVGSSAREQLLLDVEYRVFEADDDMRQLLTSRHTHLDRTLAAIYGVPAPSPFGFAPTDLPVGSTRIGLLGQVAFLANQAHYSSSSATLRGAFVRQRLLCENIPPPPSGVDTSIPEPDANARTLRERVAVHLESPSCSSCHRLMDPLGLAFETFDGIGVTRTEENDATIDPRGDLDGRPFDDAAGLSVALAQDPRFAQCMVRQVVRRMLGRVESEGEEVAVQALYDRFVAHGHRFQPLLLDLVSSPLFRKVGEPADPTDLEESP